MSRGGEQGVIFLTTNNLYFKEYLGISNLFG